MSLSEYKLTDAAVAQSGVVAAPDRLTGTAAQNKMIFDRLIRETVKSLFNALLDELSGAGGAADIGAAAIAGVTGDNVQEALGGLKTILDTKPSDAEMTAALSLKSDKSVTDAHVKSVSFNAQSGMFTFTKEDGSYTVVDTAMEKIATNWSYDPNTQSLVLTLIDGTTQSVPLSAFITETEFADSAQLAFSVSGHCVTATVKAGSITDSMLSSALIAQLQDCVSDAAASATDAAQNKNAAAASALAAASSASAAAGDAEQAKLYATGKNSEGQQVITDDALSSRLLAGLHAQRASGSANDAEAWAVGQRGGTDVPSTDAAYRNNARFYAEQAGLRAPIDLTPAEGAETVTIWGVVYPKATGQTPTPEQLRGMTVIFADGSDVTVDTLYSDADFDEKEAAAWARGETFWYIRVFAVTGYPAYWCLESAVERGYGQRDWFYLFPTAGAYYLPPYTFGTTEVGAAGIYPRDELLGGELILTDRFATKRYVDVVIAEAVGAAIGGSY